jgi:hypothetical protein
MPDKQTTQKSKNERWVFVRGLTFFHLTADVDEPFLKITAGACEDRRLNHRFDSAGRSRPAPAWPGLGDTTETVDTESSFVSARDRACLISRGTSPIMMPMITRIITAVIAIQNFLGERLIPSPVFVSSYVSADLSFPEFMVTPH